MNSLSSIPLDAFAEAAQAYCSWCEGHLLDMEKEASLAALLARLYAAALTLPEVGPENEEGLPELPEAALASAKTNLSYFNGWYYREFFDPDPTLDDEAGMGDVGDDVLDIYKDVKAGCLLYERGETADALWHWSFLHRFHWGRHAVGAIFALHCLCIAKRV